MQKRNFTLILVQIEPSLPFQYYHTLLVHVTGDFDSGNVISVLRAVILSLQISEWWFCLLYSLTFLIYLEESLIFSSHSFIPALRMVITASKLVFLRLFYSPFHLTNKAMCTHFFLEQPGYLI